MSDESGGVGSAVPDHGGNRRPGVPPGDDVDQTRMPRRAMLKILGVVPLAGVFPAVLTGCSPTSEPAASAAGARLPSAPRFFTQQEWRTVRVLSDIVIPADERSPSATAVGAPEFMDFWYTEEASDAAKVALRGGFAWMDAECQRRHGASFADCSDAQQRALIDDIAWPEKARPEMSHGVAFFNRFRDLTATSFWSTPEGYADLQYQGHKHLAGWDGCPDAALNKLGVKYDATAAGSA